MEATRPTSFALDPHTRRLMKSEADRRGLSMSGLLRALVRALANGKATL